MHLRRKQGTCWLEVGETLSCTFFRCSAHIDPSEQEAAKSKKRAFNVPELSHNLALLLEMTEEEIVRHDRRKKQLADQRITVQHERTTLQKTIESGAFVCGEQ